MIGIGWDGLENLFNQRNSLYGTILWALQYILQLCMVGRNWQWQWVKTRVRLREYQCHI